MLDSLADDLTRLEEAGLYRTLRRFEEANEPCTQVEGRQVLLFSSNNYLGLSTDHRMKEKATEAIWRYGTGSGGSRLTTGNFDLHEQLEASLASFKKKEAALLFSSGFLANVGTLSSLMQEGDAIFSDALNHASLIDGCRLSKAQTFIYRHVDMKDLEQKLQQIGPFRRKLIVTDGVFSMDGNIAPLPGIVHLARKYQAWVMVDDAHATGVLGHNGGGTAEHFGLSEEVDLAMGTLSKAVGAEGGYVAGRKKMIDYLRNRARSFIFQTSLSPGVISAAVEGLRIIQQEPERREQLRLNAQVLRKGLRDLGFAIVEGETPIIAVLIGEAKQAVQFSRRLEAEGIFAPAIRPPTVPEGSSRIRVTVMSTHQPAHIDAALQCFARIGKGMGVIR